MSQDKKQVVNEHLRHNATADTEEQVRERRRLAERDAERHAQPQQSQGQQSADSNKQSN